jgi:pimeloyl-ACP methyl ester carboxylesterase
MEMGTADLRLARLAAATSIVVFLVVGLGARGAPPPYASGAQEGFAAVNGLRLHYIDWGGAGPSVLFLTGLGGSADSFDGLARRLTDRFHVWGLTRRGQGQSDKPESGYDPRTLAGDIRAFMDVKGIERATLIGFSVAGSEMTRFAVLFPSRVDRLVYLDAANDYKSGHELATNPRTKYPLPLPDPEGPLGAIVRAARETDPDYTTITAPALAFFTIYGSPYVPADADADLRARIVKRWEDFGNSFQHQKVARFRRDMKNGRVIELRDVDHGDFVRDLKFQAYLAEEIRRFLEAR